MVQLDNKKKQYKLTFLEIEAHKPDWDNYIELKKSNYLKLAKDIQFFYYLEKMCPLLGLPEPKIEELKFCYRIIKI